MRLDDLTPARSFRNSPESPERFSSEVGGDLAVVEKTLEEDCDVGLYGL